MQEVRLYIILFLKKFITGQRNELYNLIKN